jgi:hypothetical protein
VGNFVEWHAGLLNDGVRVAAAKEKSTHSTFQAVAVSRIVGRKAR